MQWAGNSGHVKVFPRWWKSELRAVTSFDLPFLIFSIRRCNLEVFPCLICSKSLGSRFEPEASHDYTFSDIPKALQHPSNSAPPFRTTQLASLECFNRNYAPVIQKLPMIICTQTSKSDLAAVKLNAVSPNPTAGFTDNTNRNHAPVIPVCRGECPVSRNCSSVFSCFRRTIIGARSKLVPICSVI